MSTESISDRREHILLGQRNRPIRAAGRRRSAGLRVLGRSIQRRRGPEHGGARVRPGAILVQYILINVSGIYGEDEFGAKHYLFIAFMTFSLWFVTWGILLTAEFSG